MAVCSGTPAAAQRFAAQCKPVVAPGAPSSAEKAAAEEKELAKLMMTRKKQRLYERMQYGIKKKAAASEVLKQKRADIDAQGGSKKKKAKKA